MQRTPPRTAVGAPDDDDPLAALRAYAEQRRSLETDEEVLVHRARNRGLTWEAIADALGVSKQAVHQKHGGESRARRRRWRGGP